MFTDSNGVRTALAAAALLAGLGVGTAQAQTTAAAPPAQAPPAAAAPAEEESQRSLKIEVKGQVYSETTDFGAGQDRQGSRTDIHFQRMRLTLTGMLDDTWGFKFQTCGNCGTTKTALGYTPSGQDVDGNDRDIRIIDAYAIANFNDALHLKIGLTKIPLTRANLDDCFAPLSLDRSMFVYSAYGTSPAKFSRDFGAVAWGGDSSEKFQYFAAILQGREGLTKTTHPFSGATVTSTIEPSSSFEYVGRAHYSFLDAEPGGGYQGSYLGDRKIFTVGAGVAFEPKAVYKNVLPTGALVNEDTVDYKAYAADVLFEYPTTGGTVTMNAQYLKNDFGDAVTTNFNGGDRLANIGGINGQKEGWFAKGAYLLPKKIGKEAMLQPYAMYEDWKFRFMLGVENQTIKQYGGGLNAYVKGQNVRFTMEFLKTEFDKLTGLNGSRVDPVTFAPVDKWKSFNTFRMMLQIVI